MTYSNGYRQPYDDAFGFIMLQEKVMLYEKSFFGYFLAKLIDKL